MRNGNSGGGFDSRMRSGKSQMMSPADIANGQAESLTHVDRLCWFEILMLAISPYTAAPVGLPHSL